MIKLKPLFKYSYVIVLAVVLTSCDQGLAYKYTAKETTLNCETIDAALYKEALYAFEDYLFEHYVANPPNTMKQAYAFYWEIAIRDLMPAVELIDDHIIEITGVLKEQDGLWLTSNGQATINPSHSIMRCIQENIVKEESSSVLKNLLDTNSFRSDIFRTHVGYQGSNLIEDKALATYFALNNFYAKILETDFSTIERKTNNSVQNQD